MAEALAAVAVALAALALFVASRAAGAAGAARRAVEEGRTGPRRGEAVPPFSPTALPPTNTTDPSVLVRLDALESRSATLELRASVAPPPAGTAGEASTDAGRKAKGDSGRRPHAVFP